MILIISTCSENLSEEEFVRPIASIVEKDYMVKHYSEIKEDLDKFDKIIICGAALKDNKYLEDINLFDWIKNIDKPVLGICSGMQIIGLQFNAELIKIKEIGMIKLETKSPNRLFSKDFEAYELHGNSIKNLENFDILSESKDSVQAIKHKEKNIYGIMFHPEVRNESIVKNFLSL